MELCVYVCTFHVIEILKGEEYRAKKLAYKFIRKYGDINVHETTFQKS